MSATAPAFGTTGAQRRPDAVLVAVDDPGRRAAVAGALRDQLHALVLEAESVDGVVGWLAGVRPDLVYLDLSGEDVDCFDVCRDAKARPALRGVPIVVACRGASRGAGDSGCDGVVADPDDLAGLVALARRWLSGAAGARQ